MLVDAVANVGDGTSRAPSASHNQKVCSAACRRQRRARQERARRAEDLANARADERERQRQHRAEKRGRQQAKEPVSLTGLQIQLLEITKETEQKLGHAQRLSLAGLRRRYGAITLKELQKIESKQPQVGT